MQGYGTSTYGERIANLYDEWHTQGDTAATAEPFSATSGAHVSVYGR